ncbi:peptide ABC transporter permease [Microvirga terricola]|uniref:Peptide ABC transporter permease n=1 Tax=Microvirga terricola TaxID=2719797 RepID=A0ABX0VD99_9HYPH|nr:peptide ABC transporter permease [Microvirga terricola]NIX75822.1 peptide ABC transporter permease [Microvirga terricola]
MVRPSALPSDPSADAAAILRRLGFAILFFGIPVAALFTRRALVVLAPLAIILLGLAAALDGGAKHVGDKLVAVFASTAGVAGAVLLLWTGLSLIWTPFRPEAAERLSNLIGMALLALGGYLAIPDRMRSANLYILPVGVGFAALAGMVAAFGEDGDSQNLERGMIMLVLMLWPAVTWLHSRGRNLEALLLAVLVALGTLVTTDGVALQGLAVGAVIFAVTAASPGFGARLTAWSMAALLLLAPALPFLIKPLAIGFFGPSSPTVASLDAWASVILDEPLRLITGHGLETALRGRFFGLVPAASPYTFLFEIWYELGLIGAAAGAVVLYCSAVGAGGHRPVLGPGIMAAFATAYALGCFGIGTAQLWWFSALIVVVLDFVAIERGQFRTKRPKAILRRA